MNKVGCQLIVWQEEEINLKHATWFCIPSNKNREGTRVQLVTGPIVQIIQDHILVVSLLTETEFKCQASSVENWNTFLPAIRKVPVSSKANFEIRTRTFLSAYSEKFQYPVKQISWS